jgi:hypothetical protein
LQVFAELQERPVDGVLVIRAGDPTDSVGRWRDMIDPLLQRDAVRLHRRHTALVHTTTELSRRARSGPHTDDRLFTSYLIDVVTAILIAPVSADTKKLADERDRSRAKGPRPRRQSALGG